MRTLNKHEKKMKHSIRANPEVGGCRLAVGGPKWSVSGVRTKNNNKFAYFDVFSPPHSKKSTPTSQFALLFEIWHNPFLAVKVHIGRENPDALSTVLFAEKKRLF